MPHMPLECCATTPNDLWSLTPKFQAWCLFKAVMELRSLPLGLLCGIFD